MNTNGNYTNNTNFIKNSQRNYSLPTLQTLTKTISISQSEDFEGYSDEDLQQLDHYEHFSREILDWIDQGHFNDNNPYQISVQDAALLAATFLLESSRVQLELTHKTNEELVATVRLSRSVYLQYGHLVGIVEAYFLEGYILYTTKDQDNYKLARIIWNKANHILESQSEQFEDGTRSQLLNKVKYNQANLLFVRTEYFAAIDIYQHCLKYYYEKEDWTRYCRIKKSIGDACRITGNYSLAAVHYQEYLDSMELSRVRREYITEQSMKILNNLLKDLEEGRIEKMYLTLLEIVHELSNEAYDVILRAVLRKMGEIN